MGLPAEIVNRDVSPKVGGCLVTTAGERSVDWLLPEEVPVSILYNGNAFAVMMMTPQDIEDFAIGFSLTEGIADKASDLFEVKLAEVADGFIVNIKVDAAKLDRAEGRRRTLTGRSGCGLCGAQSLEAVMQPLRKVHGFVPDASTAQKAADGLRAAQVMNALNRSTHAAAFADKTGRIAMVREDIGRHNALDKLAGALARADIDAADGFIVLSSRFSVEMAQKAAAMGAGFVVSVSAPSAFALKLAHKAGMTVAALAPDGLMIFDRIG